MAAEGGKSEEEDVVELCGTHHGEHCLTSCAYVSMTVRVSRSQTVSGHWGHWLIGHGLLNSYNLSSSSRPICSAESLKIAHRLRGLQLILLTQVKLGKLHCLLS